MSSEALAGAPPAIGFFERYLTLWVALCIVAGIACGQVLPSLSRAVASMGFARVNIPVGLLIWVMIVPMLLKVDFAALGQVRAHLRGIGVTLFVNWPSSRSRWRCSAGSSSVTCSRRGCRRSRSTAASPG